jgi:tetratricopeptide (TPR) repeat protein
MGVGHTFPGGTNDSNEGWLEFSIVDDSGETLAVSGYLDEDLYLDPMAHVFKVLALDHSGKPIHRRNAQDIHSIVFSNVIGPGTADIAHYEFIIPGELAGKKLIIQARLLWRKFDREYTGFAFNANPEGFKKFSKVPELPVTEIASDQLTLGISPENNPAKLENPVDDTPEWIRYNDYGIGLFLEDDTRGAVPAFEQVEALRPGSVEGALNLAKTYIKDGNIDKAYEYLERCEMITPGDARVAWVWGVVLQEDGQYEKAVAAYTRVLKQFPEDRAVWRNLGRTYYLNQQYEQALQAFDRVLDIDPEDRITHYHRMLCFKALGHEEEYLSAKTAYEFYQIDESAQELTRAYRLDNPGANLMAQAVRTHKLILRSDGSNKK